MTIKIKKHKVLISPKDMKPSSEDFEILGTFNPSAVRLDNGDILLYARVLERLKKLEDDKYFYSPRFIGKEDFKTTIDRFEKNNISHSSDVDIVFRDGTKRLIYISHMRRVLLDRTGFKIKFIDKKPGFFGLYWDGELGVEDPRITKINNLYVMSYVSLSRLENISTSYAISNDCVNWYRRGIIFNEQNKDGVIFPEIIDGEYVAFERPESNFQFTSPHMWISHSKDLEFWGESKPVVLSKKGEWDYGRVGAGPPPIKTEKGWLLIYHGVIEVKKIRKTEKKFLNQLKRLSKESFDNDKYDAVYCAGAALFDLKNPRKLIAKSKNPILFPEQNYEKGSFLNMRILFPSGLVLDEDKKHILLFSGGGDRVVSVKKILLDDILNSLERV